MVIDRVAAKQAEMDAGHCKAEFVDQLCPKCWESGQECPYVPARQEVAPPRTMYVACGIKEVAARRWWPAYELGTYRWIWQARFVCWIHRNTPLTYCGETWIEERP